MKFDKWVLTIIPVAFAGSILTIYVRHQASLNDPLRSISTEARSGAHEQVDCKIVEQVYRDDGWRMVLEIEVRHDSTYFSRSGLVLGHKESIEKSGKIPQDIFEALQKSLRSSNGFSRGFARVNDIPTYTRGMDDTGTIWPEGVAALVLTVESDRKAGH
jgi:hypothetical protein